jgi:hypothetical protein
LRDELEWSEKITLRAIEIVFKLIDTAEEWSLLGEIVFDLFPSPPYLRRMRINAICGQSIQPAIGLASYRVEPWVLC